MAGPSPRLQPDDPERGLLLRLSIPGTTGGDGPLAEPAYGTQLQDRAINGIAAEGRLVIHYEEQEGAYADGETYSLQVPRYSVEDLAYGPMHPDTMISPRIAPVVIGMGLLEAIPEAAILALADPDDTDGDGISGRVNRVWDVEQEATAIGRFGWKANTPYGYPAGCRCFPSGHRHYIIPVSG